tara:strand:- start:5343 stop:5756 length:414 start_codon:yes stop_codon:yes gene_type:complete
MKARLYTSAELSKVSDRAAKLDSTLRMKFINPWIELYKYIHNVSGVTNKRIGHDEGINWCNRAIFTYTPERYNLSAGFVLYPEVSPPVILLSDISYWDEWKTSVAADAILIIEWYGADLRMEVPKFKSSRNITVAAQ